MSRTVTPSVPVKVEYALTDFGKRLAPILEQVGALGECYIAACKEGAKTATQESPTGA